MKGWGGAEIIPNDEFSTPPDLVRSCVQTIAPYLDNATILDPCAGQGVWENHLNSLWPDQVSSNEILLGSDFFQNHQDYDWIIGNPPFSNLTKWLEHSCLLASEGIAYILPSHALNYRRIRMMEGFGFILAHLHIFDNPKEWNLGYPHFFVVWRRLNSVKSVRMKSIGLPQGIQTRLFNTGGALHE